MGGGVASEKVGSAEVELRVKINFIRGWPVRETVLPPLPPSSTSSTMLTTRGVHRLSRKALQSAKKTNAFFSTAAAAPILARAASVPSSSRAQARPARAVPQQGPFYPVPLQYLNTDAYKPNALLCFENGACILKPARMQLKLLERPDTSKQSLVPSSMSNSRLRTSLPFSMAFLRISTS